MLVTTLIAFVTITVRVGRFFGLTVSEDHSPPWQAKQRSVAAESSGYRGNMKQWLVPMAPKQEMGSIA